MSTHERCPTLAVGVDVVDICDFAETLARSGTRFTDEVYTQGEIRYCRSRRPQHYAVRWAAKEAFVKAAGGRLPPKTNYTDIEVVLAANGAPSLDLKGDAAVWARSTGLISTLVSLSHSRRTAVAVVVLQFEYVLPARRSKQVKPVGHSCPPRSPM